MDIKHNDKLQHYLERVRNLSDHDRYRLSLEWRAQHEKDVVVPSMLDLALFLAELEHDTIPL